jgi:hypothetical protein
MGQFALPARGTALAAAAPSQLDPKRSGRDCAVDPEARRVLGLLRRVLDRLPE